MKLWDAILEPEQLYLKMRSSEIGRYWWGIRNLQTSIFGGKKKKKTIKI